MPVVGSVIDDQNAGAGFQPVKKGTFVSRGLFQNSLSVITDDRKCSEVVF